MDPSSDSIPVHPRGKTIPARHLPRLRPSLRGEAPTETLPMVGSLKGTPYRDPRVTRAVAEEQAAAEVMDLALRVGEMMLRCGAGARSVEAASMAVGIAGGLPDMDVDLTMQSLHMQCRTTSGKVITRLRVVRRPKQDFARLAAVHTLVEELVNGEVDVEQATARLREISRAHRTWAGWAVAVANGGVAAGVAMSLGAGWGGIVVALLTALLNDQVIRGLSTFSLPAFFTSAIGGALATVIAFIAYVMGIEGWIPISPSDFAFVVAGGIVSLLPSRTITSAMEDIISGFPVTGTARMFEVMLHTFGIIVGVATGLGLSLQLADALSLALVPPPITKLAWASGSPTVVMVGAAIVGASAAVVSQSRRRMLIPAALLGMTAVLVASTLTGADFGRLTATGIAGVVLGFAARIVALRLKAPAVTLAVPGSLGLMPGLAIFVGLYRLTQRSDEQAWAAVQAAGLAGVLTAFGVIFAIAIGSTLGDLLAAPFDGAVRARRQRTEERKKR